MKAETIYPDAITQAVILAGGQGTRLRPLTNDRAKPMVTFHGKPFLYYLLSLLKQQGIKKVLLLTGYRADSIRDYFGNGEEIGLEIIYDHAPVEADTGSRLRQAKTNIDPVFLLLYCDNYLPFSLSKAYAAFRHRGCAAQLIAYANDDGYSRANLSVDDAGFITSYDKSRQQAGLRHVDLGFLIARREILDLMPEGNCNFEASVYPKLVAQQQLAAEITHHRYYSVGDHRRLPATEAFLARHPTLLLDRDGVLNRRPPKAQYVRQWQDWHWLPGSLEALRDLKAQAWRVIVITNQAGIARGLMSETDLAAIHQLMQAEARDAGGDIAQVYYCPHGWDDGCFCRKPNPGMLFQAQRDFHLDLSRTFFVGDDPRDAQAAAAAGAPYLQSMGNGDLPAIVDYLTNLQQDQLSEGASLWRSAS